MNEVTQRMYRHMVWSDQKVFEAIQTLPDDALSAHISDPEWSVARILFHLVETMDWFYFCLTGVPQRQVTNPITKGDVAVLLTQLQEKERLFEKELGQPEEWVMINDDGKESVVLRSTILAQLIYHGAEHRTQIIDALESNGYRPISLDELTFWKMERTERNQ